ncbi:hypothetical protein FH972_024137 [Carpinus fangiana]|uniref:Acyl-CoA thioesterase II domain-containing protein n=1 Tax=Carpinus fangiana TaxID=176857 RepID=A0A5N6KXG4_9ROSI|nr:hypothetical protein FH972_024137 [Carpinus fangiana]
MEPLNIGELIDVAQVDGDNFESLSNPGLMGNARAIAYGGNTLGVGVKAACKTVDPKYHLYSVLGNFLGPAFTDRKLLCTVTRIRDTRTFATRTVEISQKQDNGSVRSVMYLLADYQVQEPATFLTYSPKPSQPLPSVEDSFTPEQRVEQLLKMDPSIPKQLIAAYDKQFGLFRRGFDTRFPPNSVFTQNMSGMIKKVKTTQDHLPLTDKTSTDWQKSKFSFKSQAENVSVLAFTMDAALAFLALGHSGKFFDDVAGTSSLDFALRIFSNDIDMSQWHSRELRTHVGANGRTYTESRLWDQQGNMVADMTQQCIMRPKPGTGTSHAAKL